MSKEPACPHNINCVKVNSNLQENADLEIGRSILTGSASTLHELLLQGLDAATPDSKGSAPLHYAAHRGDPDLMRILLDSTSSHSPLNSFGMTPLHVAASMGHLDLITLLLSKGASPQAADSHGRRPIHYAAGANQVETVAHLVRQNPDDLHSTDVYGQTPLHLALLFQRLQASRWLMEHGADPTQCDIHNRSALFFVRIAPSLRLKALFKEFKPIAQSKPKVPFVTTLLHKAVQQDDIVKVHYILESHHNIHQRDSLGRTALHVAQSMAMYSMLKDILDPSIIDNYGWKAKTMVEFRSIGRA